MAQFARPISDVAAGSWDDSAVGDNDGSHFDELIADDGSLTESDAVGNNTNTTNLDVELTSAAAFDDPAVDTDHFIRTRWFHDTAPRSMQAHCELWQGVPGTGTLIASLDSATDVGTTEITGLYELTTGEAGNITDYDDLHFRLWGRGTGGGPTRQLQVDLAEFEFPDGTGGTAHTATPTEAVGITDSTPIEQQKVRAEPVGITDTTEPVVAKDRTVAEPVGITDSTPVEQGKVVAEAVGITDEIDAELQIQAEVTEAVGITDATEPVVDKERTVTEAVGISDSLDLVQGKDRAEPVGITDTVLPARTIRVEITEAIGITDQIDSEKGLIVEITEPVGITDDINTARDLAREVSEPVGITDVLATARDLARTVTEAVGITDVLATARALARAIAEAVGLTDEIAPARVLVRQITEDVDLADTILPVLTPGGGGTIFTVTITEAIGITDEISTSRSPWWDKDPVGVTKTPVGIDRRTPDKLSPG